jgi:hypothetical protein
MYTGSSTTSCPSCPSCASPTAAGLMTRTMSPVVTGYDHSGADLGAFPTADAATCWLVASQNKAAVGALYWPVGSAPNATGLCYPKSANQPQTTLAGIQATWFTS